MDLKKALEAVQERLPDQPLWKVAETKGPEKRVVPRADAHLIQEALDQVLGPEGWQVHYTLHPLTNGGFAAVALLKIGATAKAGVGEGKTATEASTEAFEAAAGAFGILRAYQAHPGRWISKTGTEPQEKRREVAMELKQTLEEIRRRKLGREAVKILRKYPGYREDPQKQEKVLSELRKLLEKSRRTKAPTTA